MSRITFAEEGWADYLYWQSQDKRTLQKINRLLKSIGREGPLEGEFSRRIDSENRLVYEFADDTIIVKACRGHYDD